MSFHHSQVIPSLYYISFLCHSFIPCSFRYFSIIQMSFHHSSVIPSIIVHVDNILSFGCHSIHSMVIRALEWRGMTLWWNDRNEVRMTFQSFQWHSFHSRHPKFLRKIRYFLISFLSFRSHSVIRVSFKNTFTKGLMSEWRNILGWIRPLSLENMNIYLDMLWTEILPSMKKLNYYDL